MPKSLFSAIAGKTNAGKSSLLNLIIGEKIASVSSKPQTTRTRITGIKTEGDLQMVFIDTPGLHKPKNKLSEHMIKTANDSVSDMDVILYMTDCTKNISPEEYEMLDALDSSGQPVILLLNKIDLLGKKEELMAKISEYSKKWNFSSIIPISVKKNDGIGCLMRELKKSAKESPHFFPDDKFTDQPERVLTSEIIREKILRYIREEVPHGAAVGIEKFSERQDKDILDISAVIYCERESHKGIIIGKGGAMLKKISTAARLELERFFCIKVNLQCHVKLAENWRTKEAMIRRFGLE